MSEETINDIVVSFVGKTTPELFADFEKAAREVLKKYGREGLVLHFSSELQKLRKYCPGCKREVQPVLNVNNMWNYTAPLCIREDEQDIYADERQANWIIGEGDARIECPYCHHVFCEGYQTDLKEFEEECK